MRILNIHIQKTIAVFATILGIIITITSCKENNEAEPAIVPGTTSIRLIHSSLISSASLLDLYVDGVKVTTQPVAFPAASTYFSTTSGSKNIVIKTSTGTVIKDTVLNIWDGHQYSVFVKEWRHYSISATTPPVTTLTPTPIKTVVISDDNNTAPPDAGKAKVRFVNSLGSNYFYSTGIVGAHFSQVNPPNPYLAENFLTYNLTSFASDFVTLSAGPIRFKATSPDLSNTSAIVLLPEVMLEAGKLYTLYLVGTPGGVSQAGGTFTSTMELRLIANN